MKYGMYDVCPLGLHFLWVSLFWKHICLFQDLKKTLNFRNFTNFRMTGMNCVHLKLASFPQW